MEFQDSELIVGLMWSSLIISAIIFFNLFVHFSFYFLELTQAKYIIFQRGLLLVLSSCIGVLMQPNTVEIMLFLLCSIGVTFIGNDPAWDKISYNLTTNKYRSIKIIILLVLLGIAWFMEKILNFYYLLSLRYCC